LVKFLLHTGRWPSEIVGLRWKDLDNQQGQVMLRWAGGVQALPEHVYADLMIWHEAEGWIIWPHSYLWRRRQGYNNLPSIGPLDPAGHITPQQVTAIVGRVGRAVGIDLTPGALRNTFAVLFSTVTGDSSEASRILGNRDPKSANRLLQSPKGKAAMTEFSAALGALTAK
jgi:integrase